MSRFLSKKKILDRIKTFYNLKNNAKLAAFLGVPPTTLSSWYSRDTFDLDIIYEKCVDIDLAWLLTGEGSMLKEEQSEEKTANKPMDNTPSDNNALLYKMYIDIQSKDAEITELKLINQKQEADIKKLVKALEYYENIGTIQNFNMEQEHRVGDVPFVESLSPTPPPSARVNVRIEKGKSNK